MDMLARKPLRRRHHGWIPFGYRGDRRTFILIPRFPPATTRVSLCGAQFRLRWPRTVSSCTRWPGSCHPSLKPSSTCITLVCSCSSSPLQLIRNEGLVAVGWRPAADGRHCGQSCDAQRIISQNPVPDDGTRALQLCARHLADVATGQRSWSVLGKLFGPTADTVILNDFEPEIDTHGGGIAIPLPLSLLCTHEIRRPARTMLLAG